MINNKNLSKREMHREKKRNDFKLRSFGRMYGESAILKADYAELEAKCAETAKFTVKPHENVQIDSEASTSGSLQSYIELLEKNRGKGKIDPNQAFKEHKSGKKGEMSLEDIINTLAT